MANTDPQYPYNERPPGNAVFFKDPANHGDRLMVRIKFDDPESTDEFVGFAEEFHKQRHFDEYQRYLADPDAAVVDPEREEYERYLRLKARYESATPADGDVASAVPAEEDAALPPGQGDAGDADDDDVSDRLAAMGVTA